LESKRRKRTKDSNIRGKDWRENGKGKVRKKGDLQKEKN